jgi:tetratricopeptide (TPR) repeat protein
MAKQRRPSRVQKKKTSTKVPVAKPRRPAVAVRTQPPAGVQEAPRPQPKEAPAPAPRKPAYYEAIALYERGVQALQRHNFQTAAEHFRLVLERYPDERELVERARLYLRVCERETSRQPPAPKTAEERVYAATMSLNAGDHSMALNHLQKALDEDPESDHAHYIMAVALNMRGRQDEALAHLRQAVALNPENRSLARQDPDLDGLRDHDAFRSVLDTPSDPARRRARSRR